MLDKKLVDVCENLDWSVDEGEDGWVDLRQYSPAGEDFGFSVKTDDFVKEVCRYTADFDIDEHVEMWIEAKRNGVGGVPSVRELVADAGAIRDMLEKLMDALVDAIKEKHRYTVTYKEHLIATVDIEAESQEAAEAEWERMQNDGEIYQHSMEVYDSEYEIEEIE